MSRTELLQSLCQAATLTAADRSFFLAPRPTPCQEIVDLLPFEEFDLHLGIVGQAFPPILPQFVLELGQLAPPRGQQITAPDSPRKANDSSLIMPRSMTQIRRDLPNCVSISVTMVWTVFRSRVLPANVRWARGKPSRVTTNAMTICLQSLR